MEFFQSNSNFVTPVQVFLSKYNGDCASQEEKKCPVREIQIKTIIIYVLLGGM